MFRYEDICGQFKKRFKNSITNLKLAVPSSVESQGDLTTYVAAVTAARMAAAPQQGEQGESLDKAEKKRSRMVYADNADDRKPTESNSLSGQVLMDQPSTRNSNS